MLKTEGQVLIASEVAALQINRNDDTNQLIQCVGFTSIKEEGIGVTFELCASDTRKRHVYTSSTNQLEIVVATEDGVAAFQFFIEFEGIYRYSILWFICQKYISKQYNTYASYKYTAGLFYGIPPPPPPPHTHHPHPHPHPLTTHPPRAFFLPHSWYQSMPISIEVPWRYKKKPLHTLWQEFTINHHSCSVPFSLFAGMLFTLIVSGRALH